jgi:hypothetical protein
MWQLDTLGLEVCHVAVLTSFMEFREYVVRYDAEEAEFIRGAAWDFLQSIKAGTPPNLDDHGATYQAVRQLHPEIEPVEVELEADLVDRYVAALRKEQAAKADKSELVSHIAAAMGNARTAKHYGITVATRAAKAGGTPYVTTARGLVDKYDAATRKAAS